MRRLLIPSLKLEKRTEFETILECYQRVFFKFNKLSWNTVLQI